jgi:hypothetical protein
MATTPEGLVKDKIKSILRDHDVYFFMPVQMAYGAAGIDFHCVVYVCILGVEIALAFFIEAKDVDKEPTARQDLFLSQRKQKQKAKTFVIDGPKGYQELEAWLLKLRTLTDQGVKYPRKTLG